MNSVHITDDQLAAVLAGETPPGVEQHLEQCESCAAELRRLSGSLAAWRSETRTASEQPEWFFARQRAEVISKVNGRGGSWFVAPVMAVCLLLLMSVLLLGRGHAPQPTLATATDSDDRMLREVESDLRQYAPDVLAPAALLSDDFARATAQATASSKEKRNVL